MKIRHIGIGAALVVTTAAITTTVVSQDTGEVPEMTPEQQEMMEKWIAYATPGEEHERLQYKVGRWNWTARMWEQPDGQPSESTGVSEVESTYDGRFIVDETEGSTPWGPFRGHGVTGYDNIKDKYIGTWYDNMSTGIMVHEGTYDPQTETYTYYGQSPDVMAGEYKRTKTIERILGPDKYIVEMYDRTPEGKEWKSFELTYTRAD